jgi:hypothetical protein
MINIFVDKFHLKKINLLRIVLLLLLIILIFFTNINQAGAKNNRTKGNNISRLLVLQTANTLETKQRERQFIIELSMALDGIKIISVIPGKNFTELSLSKQLILAEELSKKYGSIAVTWLDTVSSRVVLLHLVLLKSGRTLVRQIKGDPAKKGFETDLAMATYELLGTALLFSKGKNLNNSLSKVALSVKNKVTQVKQSSLWSMGVRLKISGGLAGFSGPSNYYGTTIGLEREFDSLRLRISFEALRGPLGESSIDIDGLYLASGAGLSKLWKFGPFLMGPTLNVKILWSNYWVELAPSITNNFYLWSLVVDAGFQVRIPLKKEIDFIFGASMGFTPLRKELTLLSNGKRVMNSPFLSWNFSTGFSFRF